GTFGDTQHLDPLMLLEFPQDFIDLAITETDIGFMRQHHRFLRLQSFKLARSGFKEAANLFRQFFPCFRILYARREHFSQSTDVGFAHFGDVFFRPFLELSYLTYLLLSQAMGSAALIQSPFDFCHLLNLGDFLGTGNFHFFQSSFKSLLDALTTLLLYGWVLADNLQRTLGCSHHILLFISRHGYGRELISFLIASILSRVSSARKRFISWRCFFRSSAKSTAN